MGNKSGVKYGLPLPFSYTLESVVYLSKDTQTTSYLSFTFDIVHYPFNPPTPEEESIVLISIEVTGLNTIVPINITASTAGSLVVRTAATQNNSTDFEGKYRLTFVLTSNNSLRS
jgi:hypothetical protein